MATSRATSGRRPRSITTSASLEEARESRLEARQCRDPELSAWSKLDEDINVRLRVEVVADSRAEEDDAAQPVLARHRPEGPARGEREEGVRSPERAPTPVALSRRPRERADGTADKQHGPLGPTTEGVTGARVDLGHVDDLHAFRQGLCEAMLESRDHGPLSRSADGDQQAISVPSGIQDRGIRAQQHAKAGILAECVADQQIGARVVGDSVDA